MNINEVKKTLYKENPRAHLIRIKKGYLHYETILETGVVVFQVPYVDIQDGIFEVEMDAKHLIKWIVI